MGRRGHSTHLLSAIHIVINNVKLRIPLNDVELIEDKKSLKHLMKNAALEFKKYRSGLVCEPMPPEKVELRIIEEEMAQIINSNSKSKKSSMDIISEFDRLWGTGNKENIEDEEFLLLDMNIVPTRYF